MKLNAHVKQLKNIVRKQQTEHKYKESKNHPSSVDGDDLSIVSTDEDKDDQIIINDLNHNDNQSKLSTELNENPKQTRKFDFSKYNKRHVAFKFYYLG